MGWRLGMAGLGMGGGWVEGDGGRFGSKNKLINIKNSVIVMYLQPLPKTMEHTFTTLPLAITYVGIMVKWIMGSFVTQEIQDSSPSML